LAAFLGAVYGMQSTPIKESVAFELTKHIQALEFAATHRNATRKATLALYAECLLVVGGVLPDVAAEMTKETPPKPQ
jgi:hypothetical protein